MILFALLTACVGSAADFPGTNLSGGGSLYVFVQLGPSGDPVCGDARSMDFEIPVYMDGAADDIICIDGITSCQSIAMTRFELIPGGVHVRMDGWGEAVGMDIHDAFSRHDTQALIEFDIPQDTRVRVDWWHQVVGLASVHIEMQRIGDIGGPNDPSPPVIGRGLNGYLDFLHEDGTDLIPVDHGRWRISTWSTHQAMGEQKFTHAFGDSSHRLFFVARGDVNGDGVVDVTDLLMLLEQWGACDSPCAADVDGSGDVDVNDALQVLADWTG